MTIPATVAVPPGDAHADLTSHDTYVAGVPHATFARLRREDPVSWTPEADGPGFWSVTLARDIVEVSRDVTTFTSRLGIRLEDMDPEETEARRTLMELDPPDHTRLRRLVNRGFTPRAIAAHEQAVRTLAAEVVDRALEGGRRFDLVEEIARELPMRLLGRLLGVPDADGARLVELGDALIGNTDPEFTDHVVDLTDTEAYRLLPFRSPASLELFRYAADCAAQRRASPGDDLVSKLLAPTGDGSPLTDLEFQNFFTLMVAAGNDTTRYTMAAGVEALAARPEMWAGLARAVEQPKAAIWTTLTEEILRWGSVTMHFRRTATRDVALGGRRVRAGDKVVLWYVSGDYDEAAFADPFRFDPHRSPNDQLAFGRGGPHLCLGAWLARLEIRVLFQELARRVRTIELAGEPQRLRSNFISGIKHLPVEVTLR